jgi:hypothetical protein
MGLTKVDTRKVTRSRVRFIEQNGLIIWGEGKRLGGIQPIEVSLQMGIISGGFHLALDLPMAEEEAAIAIHSLNFKPSCPTPEGLFGTRK